MTINSSEQVGIGATPISTLTIGQTGGGNGNQLFFPFIGGSTDRSYAIGTNAYAWGELDIAASDANDTTIDRRILNVSRDGDVTVSTGDLIFGTAGKGIVLGATSNVDANTLDDYEEGTWSPYPYGSTGSAGSVSHNMNGTYIKVGSMVTVHSYGVIWNKGSWTGNAQIGGLPFPVNRTEANGSIGAYPSTAVDAAWRTCHLPLPGSHMRFHKGLKMDYIEQYSDWVTGAYLTVTVTYFTDS
jgi:hypothetical protein